MKTYIKIFVIIPVFILSFLLLQKQASARQTNVSFQIFYDQLSPYGEWVDYRDYGYVWLPDAGPDFVPYSTGGHWILTNYGWTWLSDYNWGWAPFHYGRWDYDSYYGWLWVPDNQWGPSWVTWRRSDGYYGWEPMEPGVSISASFGREYNSDHDHWIFVRDRDIERTDIHRYSVNQTENNRIIRNSSVINTTYVDHSRNSTYISGPAREDVQKVTGRRVNQVAVQDNDNPGQNMSGGQLRIYRPQVVKSNDREHNPAPSRVVNLKDVKQPSERNMANQSRNVNHQNNHNTTNVKPTQERNVPQSDNSKREQHSNTANPQNNNNTREQPTHANRANQSGNDKPKQQVNTENQQNNTRTQPTNSQNANHSGNGREKQQVNTANPQNNNNTKAQPTHTRSANHSGNNKRKQQTTTENSNNSNNNNQPNQSKTEDNKRQGH